MAAEIKEVVVGQFTGRVVPVERHFSLSVEWLLDVPEEVLWDRVQNLEGQRLLKMLLIGILQVLHIVVLLSVLKHGQLTVKVLIPLIKRQVVCASLLYQQHSQLVAVLLDHSLRLGSIELGTDALLLHLVREVTVDHLVNQSALGIAGGAGKRVEDSLLQGALLELKCRF